MSWPGIWMHLPSARTSCRDTCSGCRRLRRAPSTTAPRGGSSDRRAQRFCRWRRDRARSAFRGWCARASCRRSTRDSRPRRTRNCEKIPLVVHVTLPACDLFQLLGHRPPAGNSICLDTLSSMDGQSRDGLARLGTVLRGGSARRLQCRRARARPSQIEPQCCSAAAGRPSRPAADRAHHATSAADRCRRRPSTGACSRCSSRCMKTKARRWP